MTARDHIDLAIAHLGDRTRGAARVHALLAVAEAILETEPRRSQQDAPRIVPELIREQPNPVPQDQPAHEWNGLEVVSCIRHGYRRCGNCMVLREADTKKEATDL